MASSKPLRLDLELVHAAGAAAKRHKRSVPRQIEFWAELGRAVERSLDHEALIAVHEGLARLVVEMAPSAPVRSDDIFAALEASRSKGTLPDRVAEGPVRYQACPQRPGLLEQLRGDDSRVIGRFTGGRFVPIEE